jgi:hypothetical protein
MIGSLVTTSCSCQKCCTADYATPTPDNLPDQIAVEYSGVPSFFEPNWCTQWKNTVVPGNLNSPVGGTPVDVYYSRYRQADHPPLTWSGTLDRLVIGGVPTDEYFKFFPEGNRQTYELNGIDESIWNDIVFTPDNPDNPCPGGGGSPFGGSCGGFGGQECGGCVGTMTRVSKNRRDTFTSKFEIVAVYVARIKVATTVATCRNNIDSSPELIDSAGSAWFADIIIEIKPGTESVGAFGIIPSETFSGGTDYFRNGGIQNAQTSGWGQNPTDPFINPNAAIDMILTQSIFGGLPNKQPSDIPIALIRKPLNRYTSVRKLAVDGNVAPEFMVPNVLRGGFLNLPLPIPSLLNLEDFLTSTATEHYKRKQYLVPVQMDPLTCGVSPEEFASEYIDRYKTLDPANSEIIPYIAPSSLIRNNADPLSISLTNNDMSLPYGLYKLNVLERDNTRSSPCTIGNDQRFCNPEDSCCFPSQFGGCPMNIPCQTAVCDISPSCCQADVFGWDSLCVNIARETPQCNCANVPVCGSPTTGDCLTVHATPFCNEVGCCQTVCSFEPSCCANNGTGWTQECVDLARFFCGNGTGPGSGFTNNLTTNFPAFCNQSYYIGHGNLYKIQPPPPGGCSGSGGDFGFTCCHFSYSTCGFRYIFGQESSVPVDPAFDPNAFGNVFYVKTPPGNINYNCAYDFLKTPACILTERPIESVFGSSYLPETYRIEYFNGTGNWNPDSQGAGNTSMPFCFNLDESGSVGNSVDGRGRQWCLLPQTTFPKIRRIPTVFNVTGNNINAGNNIAVNNNGLFATSAVIRISPVSVPPVP